LLLLFAPPLPSLPLLLRACICLEFAPVLLFSSAAWASGVRRVHIMIEHKDACFTPAFVIF
jgi:hypothetical protein